MKIKNIIYLLFPLLIQACDNHDLPDRSLRPGMIYCTDGDILTLQEYKEHRKQAKAVVFYVDRQNETEGLGYAITLRESSNLAFCDTLGITQGTTTDTETMDGFINSYRMRTARAYSPLAYSLEADSYIPSVAQMNLLHHAIPVINPILEELGGHPILQTDYWYWTSTEVGGQATDRAWVYSISHGQYEPENKLESHTTRPIMTIYHYQD